MIFVLDAEGGFSPDWAEAHSTRAQQRNNEIANNRADVEDARAEQRAARSREEERRTRRVPREGEEEERKDWHFLSPFTKSKGIRVH